MLVVKLSAARCTMPGTCSTRPLTSALDGLLFALNLVLRGFESRGQAVYLSLHLTLR